MIIYKDYLLLLYTIDYHCISIAGQTDHYSSQEDRIKTTSGVQPTRVCAQHLG